MNRGFDVLVIDDDSASLDALGDLLESNGYTVRMADSAPEALRIIQHQRPKLVLTDIVMPEMSGTDLVHLIRQAPDLHGLPCVLMSGREPPRTGEPVQGWIAKPLRMPELLRVIDPIVRS